MHNEEKRTGVVRVKVRPNIWRRKNAKGEWVYEITFTDSDGHDRRQTVRGGLREAQLALADIKSRMGRGQRVVPNPKLTFADAAKRWLDDKSPNLAPKTVRAYEYALNVHLLPTFGKLRLDRIDVTVVARFISQMGSVEYRRGVERRIGRDGNVETGYAVETIKSVLIPLSRTFSYAKRHLGYAGENPVTALDLDERPGYRKHRSKKKKLNRDEIDRLTENATTPWREIIATAAALGTRLGETLGLHWRDIDFTGGVVTIAQQATSKREIAQLKTEKAYRRIEAPDWLLTMFKEQKLRSPFCGDDDLVFCTGTGKPHGHGNVLARGLYPALERAGLPKTSFHSLRHTHASLWIKDGGDPVTLSKRLGHASPQITMTTYADEIEEANDPAARKARVEALFGHTKMAALMAGTNDDEQRETATPPPGNVVPLQPNDDEPQQAAGSGG